MSTAPAEAARGFDLYAHSLPDQHKHAWEPLGVHSLGVGERAAGFAEPFGAEAAAGAAGMLHDIGKASAAFGRYIRKEGPSPDHSTAGAVVADALFADGIDRIVARLVALAIAGHHAGLADGGDFDGRLARDVPDYGRWRELALPLPPTIAPRLGRRSGNPVGYMLGFLGRMIFSCLVDADFLETERFYAEAEGRVVARGGHVPLAVLRDRLGRWLARFAGQSRAIDARRAAILSHARGKAALPPGLFTMTVPTGGGKTIASLAFALDHALAHGHDRVIYVAPYTAIIEQTAAVFRNALGEACEGSAVLEHTGTMDWEAAASEAEDDGARDAVAKLRRATENWDVPVVVTTAVQLFESLHADRTSRCRKLHNLARSVIVLDEAQALPLPLLRPCMAAIDELAASYGASVVLCTATQPALTVERGFAADKGGLSIPAERELAPTPADLYRAFKRVTVRDAGIVADADLAAHFSGREAMLCIVNTRRHAQMLYATIRDQPGARHLSTLMCAAHRRKALAEIREALREERPVRVVSTSLIEAGVDLDFAEVWRAQTGLDSIAQAAGRCNREGRLADAPVVVFAEAEHGGSTTFEPQIKAMREALRRYPDDPLGLDAIEVYFRHLYWTRGADQLDAASLDGQAYPILTAMERGYTTGGPPAPPYASVARAFRMIEDAGRPVIVPWRGGADREEVDAPVAALRHAPVPPGNVLRRLQQFTVSVPERSYAAMVAVGAVQPVAPEYGDRFMLVQDVGLYSEETGLSLDPLAMGGDAGIF